MSLFYRIMCQMPEDLTSTSDEYYEGFAEGSQKAAQIAKEADELMEEQHDVIKAFYVWAQEEGRAEAASLIDGVLTKYNAWKESTK